MRIWQARVPEQGGWLVTSPSPAVTHLLVGVNGLAPLEAVRQQLPPGALPVHYSWLEACLLRRQRVPEAGFHPEALTAAGADGAGEEQQDGAAESSAPAPSVSPLAAAAAPASPPSGPEPAEKGAMPAVLPAVAAAAARPAAPGTDVGGPSMLAAEQQQQQQAGGAVALSVRGPRLLLSDLQRMLMHVVGGQQPRPHWLVMQGQPSPLVLLAVPGLDAELLAEHRAELPNITGRLGQQTGLQSDTRSDEGPQLPAQTLVDLFSVPVPMSKLPPGPHAGDKRKRGEGGPEGAGEEGQPDGSLEGSLRGPKRPDTAAAVAAAAAAAGAHLAAVAQAAAAAGAAAAAVEEGLGHGSNGPAQAGSCRASEVQQAPSSAEEERGPSSTEDGRLSNSSTEGSDGARTAEQPGEQGHAVATAQAAAVSAATGAAAAEEARVSSRAGGADQTGPAPRFPPAFYAATPRQMAASGYPPWCLAPGSLGPVGLLPEGWATTAAFSDVAAVGAPKLPLVAVDCEMVITGRGFELARVSLVGPDGGVLLDELVVPDVPVVDYNTRYSGISAEMLAGVRTHVADIHAALARLLGPSTLLVGHTLENDLKALRLVHGRCVDTAHLFPHPKGLPYRPKLKSLAARHLGRVIQEGEHDSCVDAEVSLRLAELKFKHGPTHSSAREGALHLLGLLARQGRRVALVAGREVLAQHAPMRAAAVVECHTDEQVVTAASQLLLGNDAPPPDLLLCQLSGLQQLMEDHAAAAVGAQAGLISPTDTIASWHSNPRLAALLRSTDELVGHLLRALPPGAGLVLFSGQGNAALCRALKERLAPRRGPRAGAGAGAGAGRRAQGRAEWTALPAPVRELAGRAGRGVLLMAVGEET